MQRYRKVLELATSQGVDPDGQDLDPREIAALDGVFAPALPNGRCLHFVRRGGHRPPHEAGSQPRGTISDVATTLAAWTRPILPRPHAVVPHAG